MITLQRSNPIVTQILAAHGCQTTALQDRYDIHTCLSSFACPLGLLRLSPLGHTLPNNNYTDIRDGRPNVRGREVDEWLRHSGPGLVCLAQCISGVWYVPVMANPVWKDNE